MKELSLYILDLVQNSLRAEAKNVKIMVKDSVRQNRLEITIEDDGYGMDEALLSKVTEPFVTTRTTRQTGMGIPLFKMVTELTEGTFDISSTLGQGTVIKGVFTRSHIDMPPMGDIAETIVTLVQGSPDVDFLYTFDTDTKSFRFDTLDVREILEDIPLNSPDVLDWIRENLKNN